jgi:hypothetical protein
MGERFRPADPADVLWALYTALLLSFQDFSLKNLIVGEVPMQCWATFSRSAPLRDRRPAHLPSTVNASSTLPGMPFCT